MNANYMNPVIRQLRDQQVRFAPREKKIEQVNRAERLLAEFDPARMYPYEYLCYRITDYRPTSFASTKLSGEEASHDLRLFVEDLSDAADVPAEAAGEQVLTVEELARKFNVSTKTISRWRAARAGQPAVRVRRPQASRLPAELGRSVRGRKRGAGAARRAVQPTDAKRSATRSSSRARRLAAAGGCPADVARRLAEKTGRSVETIRYTLKQFDQEHPGPGDFPDTTPAR